MVAAMDGLGVKVHYYKASCCPEHYPCLDCGKRGQRKQQLQRQVRSIAYGKIVYLDIEYAEYRAGCDCCKTFRSTPPGIGTAVLPRSELLVFGTQLRPVPSPRMNN